MDKVEETCPAKVNLGLIIKGKRPDGYHLLQTLFYPIHALQDQVTLSHRKDVECTVTMRGFEEDLLTENNLCHKAWKLLRSELGDVVGGVDIVVEKRIPSGAGMAGGSSDAAGVLRGLCRLFDLSIAPKRLSYLAQQLGADVPFFLHSQPMLGEGIGEVLTPWPINLSGYRWEFHLPGLHSSTPEAFKALDWSRLQPQTELRELLRLPANEWRDHLRNDLEGPVFQKFPQLRARKEEFYAQGALYASMTGSGSALYALFAQ